MKFAYYPGCSLQSTAKEFDLSARALCKALNIELLEIPDWNCCGATAAHAASQYLPLAFASRNLFLAEQMGLNIMAPCAACYQSLTKANQKVIADPALREKINEITGQSYQGGVKVYSLLDIIGSLDPAQIQSRVVRSLNGLKVAAYYGCLLVRPRQVVNIDDSENPQVMDRLMQAAGADTVNWSHKVECCGASLSVTCEEVCLKMVRDILNSAVEAGADCIVCACPQCHFNLDVRQERINKAYGTKFTMPIFYFSQLLGLSMGLDNSDLSLNTHFVNTKGVLSRVG